MSITITLAGVPVAKGRPRIVVVRGKPHAYTPEATRTYEEALRLKAHLEMKDRPKFEGPVAVEMLAQIQVPASWSLKKQRQARLGEIQPTSKPDADNFLKTLDAFNGVVWLDDSQIVDARVRKKYGEPCLVVTVRACAQPVHEIDPHSTLERRQVVTRRAVTP